MKQSMTRRLAGAASGVALAALSACGGTAEDLAPGFGCGSSCADSSKLSTGQLEARFVVTGDGRSTQAEGGFFSPQAGLGFDVELKGGDQLNLVLAGATARMALADGPGETYAAAFPSQPAAATDVQVQFVRAAGIVMSQVRLPAPFQVLAPAAGTTVAGTAADFAITLDSKPEGEFIDVVIQAFHCKDASGADHASADTGASSAQYFTTTDGVHYLFHPGRYPKPSFTDPQGNAVPFSTCTATLEVAASNPGTIAADYKAGSSIQAIQVRSVDFTMTY